MRIIIRVDKDREKSLRFSFILPTSLVKTKWIWKFAIKSADENKQEEIIQARKFVLYGYKALKKYIKENGHFTLVEVMSEDAYVKIRV